LVTILSQLKQLPQLSLYNQELDKFKLYLLVVVEQEEQDSVAVEEAVAIDVLQIFNFLVTAFQ
jgi:hypothetical protein